MSHVGNYFQVFTSLPFSCTGAQKIEFFMLLGNEIYSNGSHSNIGHTQSTLPKFAHNLMTDVH